MSLTAAAVVCCGIFVFICWMFMKSRKKYLLPPGPKGNWIFGNALQLDLKTFVLQLGEMGEKFGDAYTIRIFNQNIVVLNSFDMIKEVMTSPKYSVAVSGRPPTFVGEYVLKNDEILQTYSEEWVALRKLVFRGLKHYGTHLKHVEGLVQEELKHLLSLIESEAGKSVDPYGYIRAYVINILAMLLTGEHLKYDDPRVLLFSDIATRADELLHPVNDTLMYMLPWLRHVPLGPGKCYQRLMGHIKVLENKIYQRNKSYKEPEPCFLDFMLEEKSKGHVSHQTIVGVLGDLFIAGIGTSRSSLRTLFLVVASKPDVQSKIHEEIDRKVGKSRLPCAEDKHLLPYTEAVMWEIFRLYPAAPFTSPHCTLEDLKIRNYFLPKDTLVLYNIWNVLHDEKLWKNPWEFDPSRFLDDNGDLVPPENENRQRMIAFGVGKRNCIGEVLARLRIFMALVAILQRFTLLPDPDFPLPDLDPRKFDVSFILNAPRYNITFQPRV